MIQLLGNVALTRYSLSVCGVLLNQGKICLYASTTHSHSAENENLMEIRIHHAI